MNLKLKPKAKKNNRAITLILTLILATLVFTGVQVYAQTPDEQAIQQEASAIEPTENQPKMVDFATIPKKNAYAIEHMEKKGFKYSLLKFFLAMLGVIVSAGAIFLGLNFYKKIVLKGQLPSEHSSGENSLQSPKDFKEAINLFLNKTDK